MAKSNLESIEQAEQHYEAVIYEKDQQIGRLMQERVTLVQNVNSRLDEIKQLQYQMDSLKDWATSSVKKWESRFDKLLDAMSKRKEQRQTPATERLG